eukprot:6190148-Pleurochrysis_carterae.AAC.1
MGTLGTGASPPLARSRSAATAASAARNHVCTLLAYTPGRYRSAMATGPAGRGVSSLAVGPASRGSRGRPLPPCFFPESSVGRESTSPSGMGSRVSWVIVVCARLRSDANAGGVTRASAMRALT